MSRFFTVILGIALCTINVYASDFYKLTELPCEDGPNAVFCADFNGDGNSDIAIANEGDYNAVDDFISIYLGNGNGTYGERSDYPSTSTRLIRMHGADLDGDLDIDIVGTFYNNDLVGIFVNDGNGVFSMPMTFSTGSSEPCGILCADFDNDDRTDIAITATSGNVLKIYRNNGGLSFSQIYSVSPGNWPARLASGYFNNDAYLDIAVVRHLGSKVSVYLNDQDGTFTYNNEYTCGTNPVGIDCGDIDGDGNVDIVVVCSTSDDIYVLSGNGGGTFTTSSPIPVGGHPSSLRAFDFDLDSDIDLAVANSIGSNVYFIENDGSGILTVVDSLVAGNEIYSLAIADFDNDNKTDIATANFSDNSISILMNNDVPQIISTYPAKNASDAATSSNIEIIFNMDMIPTSIDSASFAVDAIESGQHLGTISYDPVTHMVTFNPEEDFAHGELVTVTLTEDIISASDVALMPPFTFSFYIDVEDDGPPLYETPVVYNMSGGPYRHAMADVNDDGFPDIIVPDRTNGDINVFLNTGDSTGTYLLIDTYNTCSVPVAIATGDYDSDGDIDFAAGCRNGDSFALFRNNGSGTFTDWGSVSTSADIEDIIADDIDGDGDLDILTCAMGNSDNVMVRFNDGNGDFDNTSSSSYSVADQPYSLYSADLDEDGDPDVVTVGRESGILTFRYNDGMGGLDSTYQISISGANLNSVTTGDYDDDGAVEVAVAAAIVDSVYILDDIGSGAFVVDTSYSVGNSPFRVYTADLDGDNDLDLAVANYTSNTVSILTNNGSGEFTKQSNDPEVGINPISLIASDVDLDHDLDLVVACHTGKSIQVLINGFNSVCGDANGDDVINVGDAVFIIIYIFKGGDAPNPLCRADATGDDVINVGDAVYIINYIFKGGPAPVEPCCQ